MNPVLSFDSANGIFNPCKHTLHCDLKNKHVLIRYTSRAKKELEKRQTQLIIEMQIYFSCMVQKRILFHDSYEHDIVPINNKLAVSLRIIQSDVCTPEVFAAEHPEKRELTNQKAEKMTVKELIFDYQKGGWIGNFKIG